jgi:hypothetical protein
VGFSFLAFPIHGGTLQIKIILLFAAVCSFCYKAATRVRVRKLKQQRLGSELRLRATRRAELKEGGAALFGECSANHRRMHE